MTQVDAVAEFDGALRQAEDVLRRGAWRAGRAGFEQVLALQETPEVHDGLATCLRFLGALDESLAARERAYRLYRDRGDFAGATMAAAWLGRDSGLPRGEVSVARSWFAVARRQLCKTPEREKAEVLGAFAAHKDEVTAGSVAAAATASAS